MKKKIIIDYTLMALYWLGWLCVSPLDAILGFALFRYIRVCCQLKLQDHKFEKRDKNDFEGNARKFTPNLYDENDKKCNFPDDGCVHTSTVKQGDCKFCKLYY